MNLAYLLLVDLHYGVVVLLCKFLVISLVVLLCFYIWELAFVNARPYFYYVEGL